MSPRITILAFGTRGDVAPLTGLSARLRDHLGATVAVAAQRPYEQMVTDAGLEYRELPRDTEVDTRASEYGQAMVDGRRLKPSKDAIAGMRDDLAGVGEAMAAASNDADLILCEGPVGSLLGWHVAEAIGVPSAALMLQPAAVTGDFAPPALGTRSYGRIGNRTAWRLAGAGEKLFAPLIDDLRRNLGLPDQSRKSQQQRKRGTWTQLCGFSEHVVPRPRDWPDHIHVTGYWWPTEQSGYQPAPDLLDFLADGPPPVYIGLGSTALSNSAQISEIICSAVQNSGNRALVHRGWAGLAGGNDPGFHTIDDVPHDWLLPRTAAAIHHCGAGTTAATLRAGIPTIALPGIMDQPFWAQRLHRLGCAPAPIPRTYATSAAIAAALHSVLNDDASYRSAARAMAAQLAAEDGAAAVIPVVEKLLTARTGH